MMKSSAILSKNESKEIPIIEENPGIGVIMILGRGVIAMAMNGMVPTGTGVNSHVQHEPSDFLFGFFSFQYGYCKNDRPVRFFSHLLYES